MNINCHNNISGAQSICVCSCVRVYVSFTCRADDRYASYLRFGKGYKCNGIKLPIAGVHLLR